ncbi:MAG: metal-sulfur cluster assembly factor [Myxococcaceae bacterium]
MNCDPELLFPLRAVIDPELGINIVDLGLVYEAHREGALARVRMTMTTPACPMGPYLTDEVRAALTTMVGGIDDVEVDLVFEPRWSPAQMTEDARRTLGIPE